MPVTAANLPTFPAPIAVLVDGENLPSTMAGDILSLARATGDPQIRLVFGDVVKLNGWAAASGFRLVHSAAGKNAADMTLAVRAMELALRHEVQNFLIASSDGDFRPLILWLRENGYAVHCAGDQRMPEACRAACTEFHVLSAEIVADVASGVETAKQVKAESTGPAAIIPLVRKAMGETWWNSHNWLTLSALGQALRRVDPGFSPGNYGGAQLHKVLKSSGGFEVEAHVDGATKFRRKPTG